MSGTFKYLYETLAIRNDKIALRKLFKEDDAFKSIDDDTLRAISVATDRPKIWDNNNGNKSRL